MKEMKSMQAPEIAFVAFDAADVITTSGMVGNGEETTEGYSKATMLNNGKAGEALQ